MSRKLTIKEIKEMIEEEFGPVQDVEALKVKLQFWDKAKPANPIDWPKKLNMREFFTKGK